MQPPLADINIADLLQALLPVLFGIGWIAWQIITAIQAAGGKHKRPAGHPQAARPQADRPQADQPGVKQQPMRSEVEEFLRRLRDPDGADQPDEQRGEAAPPRVTRPVAQDNPNRPRKPRRPRVEVLVDEPSSPSESEPPPRRLVRPTDHPSPAAAQPQPQPQPQPTKKQASTQAAKLRDEVAKADKISQTDERVEARLHEKFDQKLGTLASDQLLNDQAADDLSNLPSIDDPLGPTTADSIAAMLRDPDNVRNAVILNEILRRPAI